MADAKTINLTIEGRPAAVPAITALLVAGIVAAVLGSGAVTIVGAIGGWAVFRLLDEPEEAVVT